MPISLIEFEKAVLSLEIVLKLPKDEITRDATIQRFEYTIELAWKTTRKIMGTATTAPKQVIREMGQNRLVDDVEFWLKALDDRNLTSHTYKEEIADQVYETARLFILPAQELLKRLKSY